MNLHQQWCCQYCWIPNSVTRDDNIRKCAPFIVCVCAEVYVGKIRLHVQRGTIDIKSSDILLSPWYLEWIVNDTILEHFCLSTWMYYFPPWTYVHWCMMMITLPLCVLVTPPAITMEISMIWWWSIYWISIVRDGMLNADTTATYTTISALVDKIAIRSSTSVWVILLDCYI